MELWDKAERLWTRVKNWKTVRGWHIWKLKLVDARLYFVSMFVGLLTGLVAVPYHYLLYYLFHLRSGFFASHPAWYWHIPLFLFSWGILVFVMWLVGKMPLIGGGGIPQTRGVINGRITYRHPFIEMVSKFVGGILSFSAGLSLGREGPSVQIGSYVGSLVSRWTHILKGEQKQLLAAGAGAGLAAAFAAPLASSLIVIESIERFDAPKTAITTLLAGVVAGAVASMVFPVNPYHLIEVTEPVFAFFVQMKYFLILAVIVSVCGKFYSSTMNAFRHVYAKVNSPAYVKMFYLVLVAYIISLMQVNLTEALGLSYAAKLRRHFTADEFKALLYETTTPIDDYMSGMKFYYRYVADVGLNQPMQLNKSNYRGQMGVGQANAAKLLNAVAGNGTQVSFPNLYINLGGEVTAIPANYFLGGETMTYTVSISDTTVATASVEGQKLTVKGLRSGTTKASITSSGNETHTFNITVRKVANGNGWL